jgi:hypothetical protein
MKLGKKDVGVVVDIEWLDTGIQKGIYLGKDFGRDQWHPKDDNIDNHRFFGVKEKKLFSIDAWSQVKQICHRAL